MLDGEGRIVSLNRSGEALFGYDQNEVAGEPFTILLAKESRAAAADYLAGLQSSNVASLLNDGREVTGRARQGGAIPLFLALGRIGVGRRAEILRRAARRHAMEEGRTRIVQCAAGGRARERAQIGLPRQGEPRDPHAAQCHSRLRRGHHGRAFRADRQRALQGLSQGHPCLRHACDEPRQRSARSLENRGGQARTRFRPCRCQPHHQRMRLADAAAGQSRTRHRAPVARRAPAADRRRREIVAADRAEPVVECDQIQRARRPGHRFDDAHRHRARPSSASATPASACRRTT